MRKLATLLVLLASVPALASAPNGLSKAQVKTVIQTLENAAGDSWNEREVDVRFLTVFYDQSRELVVVRFQRRDLDSHKPWGPTEVCLVKNMGSVNDIVQTASNGFSAATVDFFSQVNDCI